MPSYVNFSSVFYDIKNNPSTHIRKYRFENNINNLEDEDLLKQQQAFINEKTIKILGNKDSQELQKLMTDFLAISNEFRIANNLNSKDWSKMVYNPDKFEVRQFIKKYQTKLGEEYDTNKSPDGYYDGNETVAVIDSAAATTDNYLDENGEVKQDTINVKDFNPNWDKEVSPKNFFKNNMSDYYYYTADLKTLLENVDTIKNDDFFTDAVHLYIWIAFALAMFIFSFRVTDLRSLLFSIISAGVIILVVTLFCVASFFMFKFNNILSENE
jgi:Fe-S cluster biosynthesis and repair protein YggX